MNFPKTIFPSGLGVIIIVLVCQSFWVLEVEGRYVKLRRGERISDDAITVEALPPLSLDRDTRTALLRAGYAQHLRHNLNQAFAMQLLHQRPRPNQAQAPSFEDDENEEESLPLIPMNDDGQDDPHFDQERYKSGDEEGASKDSLVNSYFDREWSLTALHKMECVTPTRSKGYCSTFRTCVPSLFTDSGDLQTPALAELVSMSIGYCTSIQDKGKSDLNNLKIGSNKFDSGSQTSVEESAEKLSDFLGESDSDGEYVKPRPGHNAITVTIKGTVSSSEDKDDNDDLVQQNEDTDSEIWTSQEEVKLQKEKKKRPQNVIPLEAIIPPDKLKHVGAQIIQASNTIVKPGDKFQSGVHIPQRRPVETKPVLIAETQKEISETGNNTPHLDGEETGSSGASSDAEESVMWEHVPPKSSPETATELPEVATEVSVKVSVSSSVNNYPENSPENNLSGGKIHEYPIADGSMSPTEMPINIVESSTATFQRIPQETEGVKDNSENHPADGQEFQLSDEFFNDRNFNPNPTINLVETTPYVPPRDDGITFPQSESTTTVIKLTPEPVTGANGKFTLENGVIIRDKVKITPNRNQPQVPISSSNSVKTEATIESNKIGLTFKNPTVSNSQEHNELSELELSTVQPHFEDIENMQKVFETTPPQIESGSDGFQHDNHLTEGSDTTPQTAAEETTIRPHGDLEEAEQDDEASNNPQGFPQREHDNIFQDRETTLVSETTPSQSPVDASGATASIEANKKTENNYIDQEHGTDVPQIPDQPQLTPPKLQLFPVVAATPSPQNGEDSAENGKATKILGQSPTGTRKEATGSTPSFTSTSTTTPSPSVEVGGLDQYQILSACATQDYYRSLEQDGLKQYPYLATIVGGNRPFCSGTLITERHILTAAHFLSNITVADVFHMRVHIGYSVLDGSFNGQTDGPFAVRKVLKVVRHKGFNFDKLLNDVAILLLDKPVRFSEKIHPVCLSNSRGHNPLDQAYETGWVEDPLIKTISSHHPFVDPHILKYFSFGYKNVTWKLGEASTNLLSQDDCQSQYQFLEASGIFIGDSMLCSKIEEAKACTFKGNSGSPIIVPREGKPIQVGISSWGIGCGHFPAVHTRVSSYIPWIEKVVQRTR